MSNSIRKLFLADVFALRILLAISAYLFAFGLWFADSSGGAYNSMLRHAPAFVWGCAFFVYATATVVLSVRSLNWYVAYAALILGTYLWLFTLLSFADNPNRPMGSADFILFVLVLIEVWVGASNIAEAHK